MKFLLAFFLILFIALTQSFGQQLPIDTTKAKIDTNLQISVDTGVKIAANTIVKTAADSLKKTKPAQILDSTQAAEAARKAKIKRTIIHSAIIPGWGQVNNKQIWKVPFAAAAVGIPAWIFFYNIDGYNGLRRAYILKVDDNPANDTLINPRYRPLSANSIKYYRDDFRKNIDYSVLVFLLGWALNVADAAVFAHLKDFDVSDKLAIQVKPKINMGSSMQTNLGFAFSLKEKRTPKIIKY